jgi:hypothetical protein
LPWHEVTQVQSLSLRTSLLLLIQLPICLTFWLYSA